MYRSLIHDDSAPSSTNQAEVAAAYYLKMDDPDVILDMGKLNGKPGSSTFDQFWLKLHDYLEEIGPAVQLRHMAMPCTCL